MFVLEYDIAARAVRLQLALPSRQNGSSFELGRAGMQQIRQHRSTRVWLGFLAIFTFATGCSRPMYRRQADREAYYLLHEKSCRTPWQVPSQFTVEPDARSRFFDPTDPDHPILPPAGPALYQYQLPEFNHARVPGAETLPPAPGQPATEPLPMPPMPSGQPPSNGAPPNPVPPPVSAAHPHPPTGLPTHGRTGQPAYGPPAPKSWVQPASFESPISQPGEPAAADASDPFADDIEVSTDRQIMRTDASGEALAIPAVKPEYWDKLPANCLARMLEFATVRGEYADTFSKQPSAEMLDRAPRLTLHDIFELALINSREYQQQKQNLYQAALTVSLQRYSYATKFTTTGNGVDTTYTHSRTNGQTINSLRVPSSLEGNRLLATGGTLLGRFANDVVLRFNGSDGFSSVVNSDLFFSLSQSIFQRDIILNSLIQSERDLVYAARRFARYRKSFFLDIATSYYSILRSYRGIEIDAQNYFAQVRNFQQAEEEVLSEIASAPNPISVNQFEQGVLTARSSVIRSCNSLEQLLDNLKITIGIPTETPINIDLTELQQLTLRDSTEVEKERAQRWQKRLVGFRTSAQATDLIDILNADASLAERLFTWATLRSRISHQPIEASHLAAERARFRMDIARLDATNKQAQLDDATHPGPNEPPAPPILILQRQLDLIASQDILITRQGQYAVRRHFPANVLTPYRQQFLGLVAKRTKLQADVASGLKTPRNLRVQDLLGNASMLVAELTTLSQNLDQLLFGQPVQKVDLKETLVLTDQLLQQAEQLFAGEVSGLPVIAMSVDDAMVTALVQRLDLMNQRGALADNWRQIKIAADELRSVLNLNASQTISTHDNRPFDFSFNDSQTQLALSFDLPLNRKAQRNTYRRTLLNYNTSLRDLMRYEDDIKLQIRRQLRNLDQARVQYPISVTQAAISEEQVVSVQMQLMLGLVGVRALDLLKAFSDSREALGKVADDRIGYIIERANFAFELEAMMLDDEGFWPQINEPQYRFEPNEVYPWNAGSAYGDFPSFLKVSPEFKRMLNYAPPGAQEASMTPAQSPPVQK